MSGSSPAGSSSVITAVNAAVNRASSPRSGSPGCPDPASVPEPSLDAMDMRAW
ncbi:hypothetical protein [Streptomyces sp. NPDC050804]|uniref:hypothetical protein n=1 Tax=Streptomyces sp. NPDC050804 TaxID=3154745 RepID=UPI003422650D